ncbi:MAG: PHP domain-containing protein [Bacteroidetes bacterium]|nr:PHP domain-containing protein [Bacteroidota bacterium]
MRRILLLLLLLIGIAESHDPHRHGRMLLYPDIPGYVTLKADLHQHTVFSDGEVWPTIRVEEALKDGLDAISLTEHLEYQPHKNDIPHPDRNRAFALAVAAAKEKKLIVVNGSEITRRMPPGHSNAIFLSDANKMLIPDSVEVFREAKRQGAFVFWNHPHWIGQVKDGAAKLTDVHKALLRERLLDGIEVVNEDSYSDEALQIALDHNLTMIGSSDIHGLIDWQYNVPEGRRPVTLIFASSRTDSAMKEALFARRTVVSFNNTLIGREEFLLPLLQRCLTVESAVYSGKTSVLVVKLRNNSSSDIILQNAGEYLFYDNTSVLTAPANSVTTLRVKTVQNLASLQLKFTVLSAVTAPKTNPSLTIPVTVKTEK